MERACARRGLVEEVPEEPAALASSSGTVTTVVAVPLVVAVALWPNGSVARGWRYGVEGAFGIDQRLQLAAVQEDSAAPNALVDEDAVAFIATHFRSALGTGQGGG